MSMYFEGTCFYLCLVCTHTPTHTLVHTHSVRVSASCALWSYLSLFFPYRPQLALLAAFEIISAEITSLELEP